MSLYSQIPDDLRDLSRRGSIPKSRITSPLVLLERHVKDIRVAAYSGALDELANRLFYLDARHSELTTDLTP